MRKSCFIALLGLVLCPAAGADLCSRILGQTGLDHSRALTLERAIEGSKLLDWRLFTKRVGSHLRTLVMIGECHISTDQDMAASEPVLNTWTRIGIENSSGSAESGRVFRTMPIARILMMPELLWEIARRGGKVQSPMYAASQSRSCAFIQNLERDHRPRWSEEAWLLGVSFVSAVQSAAAITAMITAGQLAFGAEAGWSRLAIASGLTVGGGVLGRALKYIGSFTPLTTHRDETMAARLNDEIDADGEPYLGIVGASHLPGIARRLIERYGFEEVSLSSKK